MGDRQWTSMRAPRPAAPGTIREDEGVQDADVASDITKQKVAAAKNYIEQHYKQRMRTLQERKERRHELERRLEEEGVSNEEQEGALRELEQREAEIMRLQRHKLGVDDFDLLTIIGRGAFGEVGGGRGRVVRGWGEGGGRVGERKARVGKEFATSWASTTWTSSPSSAAGPSAR
ncbi:unnamed protein product [Closterium sp. NIES-54]